VQQKINEKKSKPKILEKNDEFEVIELPEENTNSKPNNEADVDELIKKML